MNSKFQIRNLSFAASLFSMVGAAIAACTTTTAPTSTTTS